MNVSVMIIAAFLLFWPFQITACCQNGQDDAAREAFAGAVAISGDSISEVKEKERLFAEALRLKPDFWEAAANLVVIRLTLDNPEGALSAARIAFSLNSEAIQSHIGLCQSLRLSGNFDEALIQFEKSIERFPCEQILAGDLVWLYRQMNRCPDALDLMERCPLLGVDPQLLRIRVDCQLAGRLWAAVLDTIEKDTAGKLEAAFRCRAGVEAGRQLGRDTLVVGFLMAGMKEVVQGADRQWLLRQLARRARETALPGGTQAFFTSYRSEIVSNDEVAGEWALTLAAAGELGLAEEILGRMESNQRRGGQPTESQLSLQGFLLLRSGRYADLKKLTVDAVSQYPQSAELNYLAGESCLQLGDNLKAIPFFQRTLDIEPDHRNAMDGLRVVCAKSGSANEAVPYFEHYLAARPADAAMMFYFSAMLCDVKEPDRALINLEQAVELEPAVWIPVLRNELRAIHSIFDCIRYRERFARMMNRHQDTPDTDDPTRE